MDRESVRDEILRCGRDPHYFICKYVKIQHPKRGLIPFQTFDYQKELLSDYQKHRFNIILKARQLGISEVTAAYSVWLMLFHRDKNILVMASKAETAKNIIKKVKTAIRKLPRWLILADINTDNKLSVELSNGSQIKAIATSEDAGRSEALSLLIIDEAAFVPRFDELWTGLYPTVAAGGNVIVLSTPNGVGNKFHELYVGAENGENEFHPTKLMWWTHPERISDLEDDPNRPGFKTSTWYRKEIKGADMDAREIAQELECNFNASGDTVLTSEQISWVEANCIEPLVREHWDRNLFVWWHPEPDKKYFISADVARGDGKDYSACHVWDAESMEQCAEYYGKIKPDEFAQLLVDLGHTYHNAMVVVENNNVGLVCLEHLRLLGYENVYYSRKGDNKPGEAINTAWGNADPDLIPGITTNQRNRPLMISKLEEYIRLENIQPHSFRFHEELKTFVWMNGRPEAMRGRNDDAIMAAAIGVWIRDTYLAPQFATADVAKKLLNNITREKHVNTEIAGASKDPRLVPYKTLGVFSDESSQVRQTYQIRMPNGRALDLKWLLKG